VKNAPVGRDRLTRVGQGSRPGRARAAQDGLERGAAYWAMSGWSILAIIIGIIVFAVMGGKP